MIQQTIKFSKNSPFRNKPTKPPEGFLPPHDFSPYDPHQLTLNSSPQDDLAIARIMPFGKYAGNTIEQVIDEDPPYIYWVHKNVDSIHIPHFYRS